MSVVIRVQIAFRPLRQANGFSLVELSIVLVILGLLTGGILAGQSLIHAAELRSVSTDFQRYQAAVYSFRDRYMALPGDMTNATAFWGTATSCPGTTGTPSTDTATCNGDGNGRLYTSTNAYEHFRFWQHLANAGLIEGAYAGVPGASNSIHGVIGWNVPASRLRNAGYGIYWSDFTTTSGSSDFVFSGNRLWFGTEQNGNLPDGAILTPDEAWNIDTKLDDGKPGIGRILTWRNGQWAECTTAVTTTSITAQESAAAEYKLSYNGIACAQFFLITK